MYEDYDIKEIVTRKDNRVTISLIHKKYKTRLYKSYPKYLMECHLGRYLTEDEIVHHKDGNPLNNEIENLEVLSRVYHSTMDHLVNKEMVVKCQMCGKEYVLKETACYSNRRRTGYFCSRQCSGRYGALIQNGRIKKQYVERTLPEKEKLINKK